uniref:Uncharacterized protein n=1 Tax=Lepeophtheirus salmonis TaxID=72036 RepID=A0A0K2V3I9_LEPSM
MQFLIGPPHGFKRFSLY